MQNLQLGIGDTIEVYKVNKLPREYAEGFVKLLNPICPFVTEELYEALCGDVCCIAQWPTAIEGIDAAKEQKKDKLLKTMIGISNGLLKVGIDVRRKLFKSVLDQLGGNLDLLVAGGAPISDVYTKGFADLGITVINGYGITECSPVVSVNRQSKVVLGSVGPVCNCCEVKIKDGEILVKGENVMLGYFQDEEATKEAFDDGWFKTGDLGYMDGEYLYITGRKKNLIILSNGKNVSPEELEDIITTKTTANEVIVYQDGDMIAAEIYAEEKEGIQEAINEINKTLPSYKQIHKVSFRDTEFEKTTTKKIKRKYN